MAEDITRRCRDRLQDISIKLEHSHLVYLQTDDSPLKLQKRQKLEGFIKEFLCLVPNDNKYEFQETADILNRSAATVQDFSGYRACNAWNAIALYAANLLAQPWRKEYKNLKTYSGYYKHEVEANLIGAELMFELMGYRHAGLGELILEGPIDPDKVSNVSRDAIVAFVECQILKQIWESVSQNFTISWLEVLEFRENHVGTPDQAIRALNYRFFEKVHHSRTKSTTYREYHHLPPNNVDLISAAPYNFPINNYNTYSTPYPAGYKYFGNENIAPQTNLQCFQPIDYNSGNRYNVYGYPKVESKFFGGINANEYCVPAANYPARVPTGQLIELDTPTTTNNYQKKDNKRIINPISHYTPDFDEADTSKGPIGDVNNYEYAKVEKKTLKPPMGSTEKDSFSSWDFVYRNLESLGYSKDLGDREDVLHKRESDLYRIRQKPVKSTSNYQEEKYIPNHLDKRKVHSNFEGLDRLATNGRVCNDESLLPKKKSSFDDLNKELRDRTYQERYNFIDRDKKYSQTLPSQHKHRSMEIESTVKLSDSMRNLDLNQKDSENEKKNKWQCSTCTFLNTVGKDICEICGKSRRKGNEDKPLASGGKECPQCTLVNEKNVSNCDACGTSLKDSPTYI